MDRSRIPEAPRDSRGASSWARKVNDSTVEWLAAWARVWTVSWALFAGLALFGLIWRPGWDWALTAGLAFLLAVAHGLVGFVWLGNPEWKDDDDDDDPAE